MSWQKISSTMLALANRRLSPHLTHPQSTPRASFRYPNLHQPSTTSDSSPSDDMRHMRIYSGDNAISFFRFRPGHDEQVLARRDVSEQEIAWNVKGEPSLRAALFLLLTDFDR